MPLSVEAQIDSLCDEFETELNKQAAPNLERWLERIEREWRADLFVELLRLEVADVQAADRQVSLADYCQRFPEYEADVHAMFDVIERQQATPAGIARETLGAQTLPTLPASDAQQFGDYEILEEIARGGMGVVYRGRQLKLNRTVALKMILSGLLASESDVKRFYVEAEAAAGLNHAGIVPIYDIGAHNGQHYYSMAFVEGGSLSDRLTDGPLPPRESARLMLQAAEAIAHAHRSGVVHRDLKPANILVDTDGQTQITDFGLARQIHSESGLTATGDIIGTPGYMPPEQARGDHQDVDFKSDVYSLGAILYCLLTGRPPFQSASILETLRQVQEKEVVSPGQLNSTVPVDLETICLKCLQKQKDHRYQTAQELADDLGRFLRGRPVMARPVGRLQTGWRLAKRNPRMAILSFACCLLLLTLAIGGPIIAVQQSLLLEQVNTEQQEKRDARTATLLTAEIPSMPARLVELSTDLEEVVQDMRRESTLREFTSAEQLRFDLAVLRAGDVSRMTTLLTTALRASPTELPAIRRIMAPYAQEHTEQLWQTALDADVNEGFQLRAACLLAEFAPEDERWQTLADPLAEILITEDPFLVNAWATVLLPVGDWLIPSLQQHFTDDANDIEVRQLSTAQYLVRFARDDVQRLVDLLVDSRGRQFHVVFETLSTTPEKAVELLEARLQTYGDQIRIEGPLNQTHDVGPPRAARVAAALFRLGRPEVVWPLLEHSSDPTLRSWIMTHLARFEASPDLLAERLLVESDESVCLAIMSSLGQYPVSALNSATRKRVIAAVREKHLLSRSAGLHCVADWLLRMWNERQFNDAVPGSRTHEEMNAALATLTNSTSPQWFKTCDRQTMIAFAGPVSFRMGAPECEVGRYEDREQQRDVRIAHSFAIAATELTREEFAHFQAETGYQSTNREFLKSSPREPKALISWNDMAVYCNWLSAQEGIAPDQWCYEPQPNGTFRYDITKTGYRLMTGPEWEYACRAGSSTIWHFGNSEDLFPFFAWGPFNSGLDQRDVALLLPNDFGLFDMHGNLRENCLDYVNVAKGYIGHRGGWAGSVLWQTRSAYYGLTGRRSTNGAHGFRIACTLKVSESPSPMPEFSSSSGGPAEN